jgi:hypothetical protein
MLNRVFFFSVFFFFLILLSSVLISQGVVVRRASVQERPIVSLNALEQTTQMHVEVLARLSEIHRQTAAEVATLGQQRTALMKEIAELTARREAETASLRQDQEQGSGEAERDPVPSEGPSSANRPPLPESSTAPKSEPASTSQPRLLVNYSPNRERARTVAAGIVRQLAQNGYTVADMRGVDIRLSTPSIRYFFSDDRSATEMASEIVSTSLRGEGLAPARVRVQNFTWVPRKPSHGTLEVWIPVE